MSITWMRREVLLNTPKSLKVLLSKGDLANGRGAGIKRALVTAIEYISAAGGFPFPLIVWPASTTGALGRPIRSLEISLYWIKKLFDPLTRSGANDKPRVLINDGFATHESLELMTFCVENNIVLCRLPSHTSHKLQPYDVGVFGSLKTAYGEQVDNLYRGEWRTLLVSSISLYSQARDSALTPRNITSGWAKTGLYPFNPDRVLRDIQRPPVQPVAETTDHVQIDLASPCDLLSTPVNAKSLRSLCRKIEQETLHLDDVDQHRLQKVASATHRFATGCALLGQENRSLMDQNNEKRTRSSAEFTVVGTAFDEAFSFAPRDLTTP